MVPGGRVELPLSLKNRILSPARLPVPPSGRFMKANSNLTEAFSTMNPGVGQTRNKGVMASNYGLYSCVIQLTPMLIFHPTFARGSL